MHVRNRAEHESQLGSHCTAGDMYTGVVHHNFTVSPPLSLHLGVLRSNSRIPSTPLSGLNTPTDFAMEQKVRPHSYPIKNVVRRIWLRRSGMVYIILCNVIR